MSNKHTPGPWTVVGDPDSSDPDIRAADGTIVADFGYSTADAATCRADMALIAAAPEMLEALRDILGRQTSKGGLGGGYYTLSGDCIRRAESAIARAEGRTA